MAATSGLPDGTAAVLAIGTGNPATCLRQDEYADWFFHVTMSDHLTELKTKLKRICTVEIYQFYYLFFSTMHAWII